MALKPIKILLVEDNPGDVRLIRESLSETGSADMDLRHAGNLAEAVEGFYEERFDAVLLDLACPSSS